MYPVTEHTIEVAASRQLRVKDEYLARVLAGEEFLLFDGAMGTMLQRSSSLKAGELPELLCLTEPDAVTAVHRAYVEAGSMVVTTNTFGANARKLGGKARVQDIFDAAIGCARQSGARYVAADIGPLGALLEPMGTLSFSDAYDLFAEQVRAADTAGADLIIIETMTDLLEAKAAVLAAKENSALPVFATMTFEESGKSFLGAAPDAVARTLEALSGRCARHQLLAGSHHVAPDSPADARSHVVPGHRAGECRASADRRRGHHVSRGARGVLVPPSRRWSRTARASSAAAVARHPIISVGWHGSSQGKSPASARIAASPR